MVKKQSKKSSKLAHRLTRPSRLAVLALVILLAAGLIAWASRSNQSLPNDGNGSPSPQTTNGINYGPPTEAQKQDATQHKRDIIDQQDNSSSSGTPASGSVTPIITSAQQENDGSVKVSAYVQGVAEDGGTCTLSLSKSGSSFSLDNPAVMNVSTTACKTFSVPRSSFNSAGNWQVVVSYRSSSASGSSASQIIGVK